MKVKSNYPSFNADLKLEYQKITNLCIEEPTVSFIKTFIW
jgi:hypothetical protein